MNNKLKSIFSSASAATVVIIAAVIMTLGGELSVTFKNWLTSFTGHHWLTKSWASIIIFVVSFSLFEVTARSVDENKTRQALVLLQCTTVAGFLVILGFYLYEFFKF